MPIPQKEVPPPATLGEHLRHARTKRGIRQKDAALELGVAHDTYMCWEKDQKLPFPRYYPAIIQFVGYSPLPEPQTEGEKLRYERLTLGLTTKEMAKRLGIDQGTLIRRENA